MQVQIYALLLSILNFNLQGDIMSCYVNLNICAIFKEVSYDTAKLNCVTY